MTLLVVALICLSNSAPVKKPPTRLKKAPNSIQKFDPFVGVKSSGKLLFEAFSNNAVANIFKNTYSFFYWLPRRNIPFDTPWKLFGTLPRLLAKKSSQLLTLFILLQFMSMKATPLRSG